MCRVVYDASLAVQHQCASSCLAGALLRNSTPFLKRLHTTHTGAACFFFSRLDWTFFSEGPVGSFSSTRHEVHGRRWISSWKKKAISFPQRVPGVTEAISGEIIIVLIRHAGTSKKSVCVERPEREPEKENQREPEKERETLRASRVKYPLFSRHCGGWLSKKTKRVWKKQISMLQKQTREGMKPKPPCPSTHDSGGRFEKKKKRKGELVQDVN